ncbi:aminodeoxychorismate synthase component I [Planococcus sp. 1R117A]|uniref:aminodeoxychorismate synthase component I n=1 Tax=Planococcus sp. 1R117A TaxID=3447020 RepID=UPI003EDC193D
MTNPYLMFEFQNDSGKVEPIAFQNPIKVLETVKIEEVPAIMESVEQAVQEGFYAAGYVSYEAAPAFHPEMKVRAGAKMPLVWFGIFEQPVSPEQELQEEPYQVSDWKIASSIEQYKNGIERIKDAIEEGHTYQVNYTDRLHANFTGSDRSFYRQLARNQQAGYSAYLNLGKYRVLSASPELFFRVKDGKLTTKPMKGTAPRGRNISEDKANTDRLLASEKERAENLMIVDLLRNDLSRLAKPGTVTAAKLFEVETYPTVLQLTSTVEAELDSKATVLAWFQALFPCGSITGAPKISTMKTIAALEQSPREVYCGAIGFITPEKNAIFNVPIRTVVVDAEEKNAHYGVGGGITWDSTSEGEYQELSTKAQVLTARRPDFDLLESLKLEDGKYPLLSYHLNRLKDSSHYFNFPGNTGQVERALESLAKEHPKGIFKVRLLMDKAGTVSVEAQETAPIAEPVNCELAASPIDSTNPFLFHKTTYRKMYDEQKSSGNHIFSVLLWNEKEELTEFTIGNAVFEKAGKFFTPPVSCGLLPGTFRQYLLDREEIEEKVIHKKDLRDFEAVWFINSVRGWLKVEIH